MLQSWKRANPYYRTRNAATGRKENFQMMEGDKKGKEVSRNSKVGGSQTKPIGPCDREGQIEGIRSIKVEGKRQCISRLTKRAGAKRENLFQ